MWLPHFDDYDEVCDCKGEGMDCDGNYLSCAFGNAHMARAEKKFAWMIPFVSQYVSMKKDGMDSEAEQLKQMVLQ